MADYTERFSAELGARLRRARESRGMSLADVQKASGGRWAAQALRTYEVAERGLKVEEFEALARFYGLDPGQLADGASRAAMMPASAA